MAAFDGYSNLVSVYFDSEDEAEINVSLSDADEDQVSWASDVIRITPEQAIEVIEDLLGAVITRGRSELVDQLLERVPTWKEN